MLRINLLPPYIYEGAKRRNITVLWVVLLAVLIGGFVWAKMGLDGQVKALKDETARRTDDANRADQAKADADKINGQSETIRGKADFVKNARVYNDNTYPPVFSNIVTYTTRSVLYDGATPAGQTVTLPAFAPSLADVGHYIIAMERNPNISNVNIAMNSIPGFPLSNYAVQGNQSIAGWRPAGSGHDFTATLTLLKPIPGGPAYPVSGGGAVSAGPGGGAMGPMGPGGMGPMGPMGPGGMGPMGSGGGMAPMGPMGPGGPGMMGGPPGGMGGPGMMAGGKARMGAQSAGGGAGVRPEE